MAPKLELREQDLVGKVAIITGATKNIGRATALQLATRGCSILATCSGTSSLHLIDSLSHSVAELYTSSNDNKPVVVGLVANIYDAGCAETIADAIARHFSGHVDILSLNASSYGLGTVGQLTAPAISECLLGNVQTSALIVDELVKRKMFRPGSRIIFVSSVRDRMPNKYQIAYSASKAAGESLCRTWAEAFGGKDEDFSFMAGTTANAVLVGLVATSSVLSCPPEMVEGFKKEFITRQDIPGFAEAEEISDAIGMLCSRDARWITGQTVSVSGGCVKLH